MADDTKLQFSFELIDNVSDSAEQMASASEQADDKVDELVESEKEAIATSKNLDTTLSTTQMNLLTQMAVIGSLDGAVRSISNGLTGLGLVGEETAQKLTTVSQAFGLIKGSSQALVAVKALMTTLNAQTAIQASLSSYLAVLKNPAMLAGVALAGGTALGVAGAYLYNNSTSTTNNNTTNITVQDTTPQRAQTEIYKVVSGGAL